MIRHPEYTRARAAQLTGDLHARVYAETASPEEIARTGATGRIRFDEARRLELRPAALGDPLGPLWATYWFRVRARVPEAWAGSRVDLLWITHSEATLWSADGRVMQGLNHQPLTRPEGSTRADAIVVPAARGGEGVELWVEVACNGMFGRPGADRTPYAHVSPFVLDRCEIARFDREAWDLYFDALVLRDLEREAERGLDPALHGALLAGIETLCNACDPRDRATWPAARAVAKELLARRNAPHAHEVYAIGHAHIDTAWLWPLAESYRKCERTFSSQVAIMETHPEHRFACSQAQHLAWVKERNPELFARIARQVNEGRFVLVGGMWVEPDCNLPSGESLVRQALHGQRFYEREFGVRCREAWLPDAFGYCAQLPQILRGAGLGRFVTQKLSWNKFTKPEHHTFHWEGQDGSRVLAHFPPSDTYSSIADVADLRKSARAYRDHDRAPASLLLYGHGDGGGGPTRRMLEVLRRAADLEGVPRTSVRPPSDFFDRLERVADDLHVVAGELYLEYHRGTYTSQARIKRGNRRAEILLHEAELLAACAARIASFPHSTGELAGAWEKVLVNQFHDILPGSSIAEVNDEALRAYDAIEAAVEPIAQAAASALVGGGGAGEHVPLETAGVAREEVVDVDGEPRLAACAPFATGALLGAQAIAEEEHVRVTDDRAAGRIVLENAHLRAVLADDGRISSLVSSGTGREALAAPGNVFELYDDRPVAFDAWDVDPYHLETGRPCAPARAMEIVERGPLRAAVAFEHAVGQASTLRQRVVLAARARRIEVHVEVDWRETNRMLKVAFPVRVRAPRATYEMPFGYAERPTHRTTARDEAQYEVPGHSFADLSEHGFGVALLSRDGYGMSTHEGTMRLSLLRAPTSPDPRGDHGLHALSYAIFPHAGGWREAGVVREARAFRFPLRLVRAARALAPLFSVEDENLVLDTVKRAEGSDDLVLRFYEAHGARGAARVRVAAPFSRARLVTLLEEDEPGGEIAHAAGAFELAYAPHRIVTVRLS